MRYGTAGYRPAGTSLRVLKPGCWPPFLGEEPWPIGIQAWIPIPLFLFNYIFCFPCRKRSKLSKWWRLVEVERQCLVHFSSLCNSSIKSLKLNSYTNSIVKSSFPSFFLIFLLLKSREFNKLRCEPFYGAALYLFLCSCSQSRELLLLSIAVTTSLVHATSRCQELMVFC